MSAGGDAPVSLVGPVLKYTLARLGLLLAVFVVLLPLPVLSVWSAALAALMITMVLSWFALRGWRDQAAVALAAWARRRRERREELRAALAGDDQDGPQPGHQ